MNADEHRLGDRAGLKFGLFEREMIDPLDGHELSNDQLLVALLLLDASSARPIGISEIQDALISGSLRGEIKMESPATDRAIKALIRSLRREHQFPILSRKGKPAGYWWCASSAEMEQWIHEFRSQALDELTTVSKIVRANYPMLAGQLRLDGEEM